MQPAPPEHSHTANSENTPRDTSSNNQHGPSAIPDETSDSRSSQRPVEESSSNVDVPDDASVASSATSRGRRAGLRRMSSDRNSQDSSPGSRIDAYEKTNAIVRRPSDGMIFQVVPSSGQPGDVSLLDMPNGRYSNIQIKLVLTLHRGAYSHPIASPS